MSHGRKGEFGYGAVREYRDDPDDPGFGRPASGSRGYQATGYGDFHGLVDQISSNIFTINNNATTLERALKQIGTSKDSVELRDKLHLTEQTTNRIVNETLQTLKRLSGLCSRQNRQQRLQHERLTAEFKETFQRYNTLQKKVAEAVKSAVKLSAPQQQSNLISWQDAASEEAGLLATEQRREQLMMEQEQIDVEVSILREREERIHELEADILDINEIFQQLGTLVHEQGEVINTIEDNVEATASRVEGGNEQLQKASHYQRKARKKMCCLVAILLVIVAIVVVIIVLSVKKK